MNKFLKSLLAFFLFSSALSAETGYIQIKAPSGIMIFLDGNLKGKTTSEQGGLILQDVPAGTREIKALKAGANPKIYRINVKAGDIAVWDAGVFAPKIMVKESGETEKGGYQPIGSLQIKSIPVDMKISIQSLGLNYSKTKPDLEFSKIPAGEYLVNFSGFGKSLSSKITIYDKVTTEVFVNMLKGEVQNKTEEERRLAMIRAEEERRGAMIFAEMERKEKEEERKRKEEERKRKEEERKRKEEEDRLVRLAVIRFEEEMLSEKSEIKSEIIRNAVYLEKMPNKFTGWAKQLHATSQIWILAHYKQGRRDGYTFVFYENGQPKAKGNYKEGKLQVDTWIEYEKKPLKHFDDPDKKRKMTFGDLLDSIEKPNP